MNNFVGATSVSGNATRAGRVRVLARDPPGQRSVYIPPGKLLVLVILETKKGFVQFELYDPFLEIHYKIVEVKTLRTGSKFFNLISLQVRMY